MGLLRKVRETVKKYSMLSENDRVLIGLSGGPDSVCLAVVLDRLREEYRLSLSALYIDHGLRPGETDKEIEFCIKFCGERDIDFSVLSVNVSERAGGVVSNLQEAARELRYRALDELSERTGAARIALGHNADDQAETVLMRLLRGSGRKGLSGIPPVRGKIIRPLIEVERREIEEFLSQNARRSGENGLPPLQPYVLDSSNMKQDYLRNWIRHSLMDGIRKRNPSVVYDICRTADIFREEDAYLELKVTKTLMRLISRKSLNSIELFLAPLEILEKPLLRRVLRRAIDATEGLRSISYRNIEDIIKLIKLGNSGDIVLLPRGIRVIRDYSILKVTTEAHVKIGEYELLPPGVISIHETGDVLNASLDVDHGEPSDGRNSVVLDAGAMVFPLRVRHRRKGDFFYPLGFGKKKKLQDFFVDEKVPRDARDGVPIVMSGNDIIWVGGYRADDRFKVTDKTVKYLRLTLNKLDKNRKH